MTRVAIVGPSYPYRGGIAHYTASLASAFEKAGHETRVYNFSRQYPKLLFPGKRQTDVSRDAFEFPSLRTIDSMNPLSWVRTASQIAQYRPTLLVFQWWHPYFAPCFGTIARLVKRQCSTSVVFLCHNVMPHEASRIDRTLLRYAYQTADAFLVQASSEREKLRQLIGSTALVAVAPHPTYDRFAEAKLTLTQAEARRRLGVTASRVLLFFGLIRPYKGLSVLLDAMPHLETDDVQLVIAGECYENRSIYRRQIDHLGLRDRVLFNDDYIPNEEVPTYFTAADVVVLPYISATQSGIVQVAYAFGVPVIVSAVGGIPEVVEDGRSGLLVPPGNASALAASIDRFFAEDLGQTFQFGIEAKRLALSWSSVVEALRRIGEMSLT